MSALLYRQPAFSSHWPKCAHKVGQGIVFDRVFKGLTIFLIIMLFGIVPFLR